MTETGPCLVEVNSRCHGAAGAWMSLARSLTGYTQVCCRGEGQRTSGELESC